MTARLHFLGMPRLERDGETASLPAKAIALLAYLAASEGPQPRDRILGLLWAESAEDAARKNLRNLLWAVRRGLGDDAIAADADRLALGDGVWADVRQLERAAESVGGRQRPAPGPAPDLRAVLALYRGPFLDGLSLADAAEFELWALAERERLAQAYLRLAAAAIADATARGDWHAVIAVARQALGHDPLHEPFYRALMEAHGRLGERGEALRQYDALAAILARELGVAPLPETDALRDAIAAGGLDAPQPTARPALPQAPGSDAAGLPFVGRSRELAALDEELRRAAAGEARVAAITGELGIGKSRLWQQWLQTAEGGCTALAAACVEATQGLPFAPLTELFAAHPCTRALLTAGSPVPAAWLAEVARLLPEVRHAVPGLPPAAALPLEEERHRIFEAFVQVLLALPARPLVIFVDDVHWADSTTLEWLAYLVHRLRRAPLLLVLAYRPDEAPAGLAYQVAAWGREGILRRIALERLAPEESAALIAALHVPPQLTHQVQFQSAGNPYFLIELSRTAVAEGMPAVPPGLADLLRARLSRLPGTAQQVLQAAAVLEPAFDAGLLRRVSGRSEEETLDALDALLAAGILVERAEHLAFGHPLVARVVRDALSGPRRAFLHRRAAEALEAAHGRQLGPVAARLMNHALQAGDPLAAARYADLAGRHALALAAAGEAVGFFRQALALDPTPLRHLGLGDALYQAGDLAAAREAFEAALASAQAAGDRPVAARACLGLAETCLPAGRPDELMRWATRSLEFLDADRDPVAHARAHFLLGAAGLRLGGPGLAEARSHLAEASRLAEEHAATDIALLSRFELGNLLAEAGDLPAAVAMYQEVAAAAAAVADPHRQVLGHNNAAYHAMLMDDLATAHRHLAAATALAEAHDLRLARQYPFSTAGEIALAEARWDEAEAWFRRSLAEAESHGNLEHSAKCHANLALAARGRGDLDAAVVLLEQARRLAEPLAARFLQIQINLWLAETCLARGAARPR